MVRSGDNSRPFVLTITAFLAFFTTTTAFAESPPDLLWQRGGHGGIVYALDYSPQGDVFASASLNNGLGMQDRTIKIWRGSDGILLRTLAAPNPGGTIRVRFSPDGTLLAAVHQGLTFGSDSAVDLWDVATGALVRTIYAAGRQVTAIAYSQQSSTLAAAHGVVIQLFDSSGNELQVLNGSAGGSALAFSPDETLLASADQSHTVIWEQGIDGIYRERQILSGGVNALEALAFSRTGDLLAAGSGNNVQIWRSSDGSVYRTLNDSSLVTSLAFAPDREVLAEGGDGHLVNLWNVEDGSLIQTLSGNVNWIPQLRFSGDGSQIVYVVYARELKMWRRQNNGQYQFAQNANGHTDTVFATAFSPTGKLLASGAAQYGGLRTLGEVKLWDAIDGQLLQTLTGHTNGVYGVSFRFDGELLASASWDRTIKIWQQQTGGGLYALLQTLEGHTDRVNAAVFSGADLLATASRDTTIKIWTLNPKGVFDLTQTLDRSVGGHEDEVEPIAFAANGSLLISGGHDSAVKVWMQQGDQRFQIFQTLSHPQEVESAAVSSDGSLIAAGGEDGAILVWQRQLDGTYNLRSSFKAIDGAVHSIAFLPDGQKFVSAGGNVIQFWTPDGDLLIGYDQETGTGLQAITLSPNGNLFAYARTDATVSVANTPVELAQGSFDP